MTIRNYLMIATTALFAACTAASEPAAPPTSEAASELTRICTPGEETCDFGCYYDGGPSTDDCIIKCNARGTGWITITNCGWAQNGQTSASCLDREPHPVCENN